MRVSARVTLELYGQYAFEIPKENTYFKCSKALKDSKTSESSRVSPCTRRNLQSTQSARRPASRRGGQSNSERLYSASFVFLQLFIIHARRNYASLRINPCSNERSSNGEQEPVPNSNRRKFQGNRALAFRSCSWGSLQCRILNPRLTLFAQFWTRVVKLEGSRVVIALRGRGASEEQVKWDFVRFLNRKLVDSGFRQYMHVYL